MDAESPGLKSETVGTRHPAIDCRFTLIVKLMDMNDILLSAPEVLGELTRELVRRGDEEYRKNPISQTTACFFLAIRSASLLCGMAKLMTPPTRDSLKVLARGFLESRDLLLSYRFDHEGTRKKIGYWFAGNMDNSWKAEHKKCEEYLERLGHGGAEFAKKWSQTTTLAHPTRFAAQNSVFNATLWAANPLHIQDFHTMMEPKIADYLTSIASLVIFATYDLPGLISLECDLTRIPHVDEFRLMSLP